MIDTLCRIPRITIRMCQCDGVLNASQTGPLHYSCCRMTQCEMPRMLELLILPYMTFVGDLISHDLAAGVCDD